MTSATIFTTFSWRVIQPTNFVFYIHNIPNITTTLQQQPVASKEKKKDKRTRDVVEMVR